MDNMHLHPWLYRLAKEEMARRKAEERAKREEEAQRLAEERRAKEEEEEKKDEEERLQKEREEAERLQKHVRESVPVDLWRHPRSLSFSQ